MKTKPLAVLKRFCEIIETLKPEVVDMAHWAHECGTKFCIAGHACNDPWMNSVGLKWKINKRSETVQPHFGGQVGFNALRDLLSLDSSVNGGIDEYLFISFGYIDSTLVELKSRFNGLVEYLETGRLNEYWTDLISDMLSENRQAVKKDLERMLEAQNAED